MNGISSDQGNLCKVKNEVYTDGKLSEGKQFQAVVFKNVRQEIKLLSYEMEDVNQLSAMCAWQSALLGDGHGDDIK